MNTAQMYYYVAVCKHKSFSRAAEALYISQPTLSKQIAALEKELGTQLINRKTRGLFDLTPVGEEYLKAFNRILRDVDETAYRTRQIAAAARRSYCIGLMEGWYLPELIRYIRGCLSPRFADVNLEFLFLRPGETTALRKAGRLDIVLMQEDVNWPVVGYSWKKLRDLASVLYVSAANSHIQGGDIQISQLKGETLYAPPSREVLNAKAHPVFQLMGSSAPHIQERNCITSIHMEVLSGNGYSFADEWSDVVFDSRFFTKTLPEKRGLLLSWREEDDSELTKAAINAIKTWIQTPSFPCSGAQTRK